jgi:PBP1b-binding outer membrane lipoprotein LpoB
MKYIVRIGIMMAVIAALVMTGCASAPEEGSAGPPERRDLPEFFLNPPQPEDQFVGLGMAKLQDDNLSRTTALARARADIAAQVAVSVETMLTDYAQESGADNNTQTLTFVERVTKEVADIELRGAVTKEQYPSNDGTWYVMVYF